MPEPGVAAKQITGPHDSQKEVSQMTSSDTSTDHPVVFNSTVDDILVESTLSIVTELRADGFSPEEAAQCAAEFLAMQVASFGGDVNAVAPDYDPTDAELEVAWNAPDAPEAHRAAWALHQELRS
jgi:hypothetical protein